MVQVDFMDPIQVSGLSLKVSSMVELKQELEKIPQLQEWLDISAVAVNDTICDDINLVLKEGDRVVILPPVCGG